jgi:hypothetical protein
MASKYILKTFLYCSGVSIYYPCIHTFHVPHSLYSIHKLLYFSFFSASFCTTFLSSGIATSISMPWVLFFVYNYNTWPICCNFSVFTAWFHNTNIFLHTLAWVCVYPLSCQCLGLWIENNANVQNLCVSLRTHSAKMGHVEVR